MTAQARWESAASLLANSSSYWETCTLHAAVDLGIFTLIDREPKRSQEIAELSKTNEPACEQLLNALCAIELLEMKNETYANTDFTLRFLHKSSINYLGYIVLHHKNLMASWSNLSDSIRSGKPGPDSQEHDDVELRDFLLGMANMGMINGPGVLNVLDLKGRKKLLDVGSGPGAYSVQFCQHYPELHATLFDRETTKPFARDMIKRYGLEDRMKFTAGDFIQDALGSNYDVIWGSHILHSNPIADVQALITTFFDALQPGGELLIQEFILDDSKCSPKFPALFSLNMLINTPDGRSYAQGELEEMMREAGFNHLLRLEPPGPASILRAIKPE